MSNPHKNKLSDVLREIRRLSPVMLNEVMEKVVDGQLVRAGFADDHRFTVEVPAWVFRALADFESRET